jgi:chromosome segregation ATPase
VNEPIAEIEISVPQENNLLEGVFKVIWEKTRAASDLINQLREERRDLAVRVTGLETEVQKLLTALADREQEFRRLKTEHTQLLNSNGSNLLTEDDKERLKARMRDLIAKINSYL